MNICSNCKFCLKNFRLGNRCIKARIFYDETTILSFNKCINVNIDGKCKMYEEEIKEKKCSALLKVIEFLVR